MKHKYKEKCDICGKWSDSYTTINNGTPMGVLICDECKSNETKKVSKKGD